jgi:DNA replication and repair protein RecF
MVVTRLVCENFRNLQNLDLPLKQGFVVVTGENGAGKTNLLESIYFTGTLRRFPESRLDQLFQIDKKFLRLRLIAQNQEEQIQEVVGEIQGEKRLFRYKINNVETARNHYAAILSVISFLPQDLNLLGHSPANRRRYLDEALSLTSAQYRHVLNQYDQILRQRNEFLGSFANHKQSINLLGSQLEIWDEKLAECGSFLNLTRGLFLEYLNNNLRNVLSSLSWDWEEVEFEYQMSGGKTKKEFLVKLQAVRNLEQERGITMVGPHRDDFKTMIQGRRAVGLISRGQTRTLILALKFLERQYHKEKIEKSPIVLLDDVFSEFDRAHQQKLLDFLKGFEQVFFTTTHLEEVEKFLPPGSLIYKIANGGVD